MKKTRNIVFIVELLLLFVILLFVIVTATRIFMKSRSQSLRAQHLTEAVSLAEEIAEVTRGLPDPDSAAEMLGTLEEVTEVTPEEENAFGAELLFTDKNGRQDAFRAGIVWEEEKTAAGRFISEQITVLCGEETDPLYELETGWYQEDGDGS